MKYFDGNSSLPYVFNDGGRSDTRKGFTGDCVARSVAIAADLPYEDVYARLAEGNATQRASFRTPKRGRTASSGINVKRKWFKDYMASLGFEWTPTMLVGQGCKVHLLEGELPMGRLVVSLSKHYTAVIDGVINDTYDPSRTTLVVENGQERLAHRCVYGYWAR